MNAIKVEVGEEDELSYNSCLICLQQVTQINEEQFNSLNFFFNYLKIGDEIKEAFVCEKCGEKLAKFVKLCKTLEKVRLEMDYLLGFIQSSIISSRKDVQSASLGFNSAREAVVKKCKESIYNPTPKILVERLHNFHPVKSEQARAFDWCDDWSPTLNDEGRGSMATNKGLKRRGSKKKQTYSKRSKGLSKGRSGADQLMPFKCPTCSKTFRKKRYLTKHTNIVHLRLKPHKCDLCDKSFALPRLLQYHQTLPHNPKPATIPKPFDCEICKKSYESLHSLKLHKKCHGEKRFLCDICNKRFINAGELKQHVSGVHEKQRSYCLVDGCDRSFWGRAAFLNHYRLDHPDHPVPLKRPERRPFFDKFTHETENGESVWKCKICECKIKNIRSLSQHLREVHESKKFLCSECGYATPRKAALADHIESKHGGAVLPCEFCGKQFNSGRALSTHLRIVHGPKQFKCQNCSFESTLKFNYLRHLKQKQH